MTVPELPAELQERVDTLRDRINAMTPAERIRISAGPVKGGELDRLRHLLDNDTEGDDR